MFHAELLVSVYLILARPQIKLVAISSLGSHLTEHLV